jgi:hypothetical protein
MRNRFGWLAHWSLAITIQALTVGGLLAPTVAWGQNGYYEVPPPATQFPYPLGHPRMEDGGFYTFGEFLFWQQTNPLKGQLIAFEGFNDRDGSIGLALGIGDVPGQFIGSRRPVLSVDDVSGPLTYQPGFNFGMGWRFRNGIAVEFSWIHLWDARYSATASLHPAGNPGFFLENTFLTAPVFNYPSDYDGPGNQVGLGNVGATSGIWNAASLMTIDFVQRFDQFQMNIRYPLQQTECWRTYGLFGPRIAWIWERFKWRTVDQDVNGVAFNDDAASYTNVVSNRLYGIHFGMGNEWHLGATPMGAFSISLDLEAAIMVDFVKGRAKYEIGDEHTAASRARNFYTLVPELQGSINVWWYPYEAIQVRFGYSGMAFFNTMASPRPIDFNYGALAPAWEKNVTRIFHGLNFGVAVIF